MTSLHDPLSDLVTEVPHHIATGDLARDAWRAGRRRRLRRRAAVAGAAAAVVALLAPAVPPATEWVRSVDPAGARPSPMVDGYPQRIGHPWWLRELPEKPGVLAGVLTLTPEGRAHDEMSVAVSESGRQWRIPDAGQRTDNVPTLSNTGRLLGYFAGPGRPRYVIHDLTTGERTEFDRVRPHDGPVKPFMVHMQTPAFWSPDDSRLLLLGITPVPGQHLLLGADGSLEHVRGEGTPLGWVDGEHLAWLDPTERGNGTVTAATVAVTDTDGVVTRRVDLDLPRPLEQGLSQWSGAVSPGGDSLALVEKGLFSDAIVHLFSLADGSAVAEQTSVFGPQEVCQLGWAGTTPVVPTRPNREDGALAALARPGDQAFVVADPGLDASCLTLAAHAASGDPHGGLFGTSTAWWTWWWKEALLVAAATAALWWAVRRRRESPRSRRRAG